MNTEDQSFAQLLYIFYSSAMVALGKLKNPATDKIERNLDQAKQSIDILEVIS
jgi:F0F1-type ATP synthase membrane subunit b/b'